MTCSVMQLVKDFIVTSFLFLYYSTDYLSKCKTKRYHTIRTVSKSNRKIVKQGAKMIPITHPYT